MSQSKTEASESGSASQTDATKSTTAPAPAAGGWNNPIEFILISLGFAVGLGNIWRFPNMVFSNGGGAFLIPYGLCLLFIAIPLLLVEAAMGQYSAKGPIGVWDMVPLFRGCGIAAVVLSMISTVYYNAPISWAAFYLVSSVNDPMPWTTCGYWSTVNCTEDMTLLNDLASNRYTTPSHLLTSARTTPAFAVHRHDAGLETSELEQTFASSPAEEYFYRRTLNITSGLRDWGSLGWELLLCNLVIWFIIFAVVCKGADSLGKVAYFTTLFPYFMLTAMLIFTSTLPGADLGIRFYLEADLSKLADIRVWRSAVSQVFFSTGCASGGVIQMASYNRFEHNIVRDTILVPILDGLTSLYAGFGVFTILGYMAHQRGVSVENVVESGPGLIFITYPEALAQMPGGQAWAFFFFFMICILGLSSQFPSIETICGQMAVYMPWTQRNAYTKIAFRFFVCMAAFLAGIFFYFGNGYFSYFLIDERVIGYPMILIGLFEVIGIAWVYGSNRMMSDIEEMTGSWRYRWVKAFWIICWKFVAPIALGLIFILDVATLEPLEVLGYVFPNWALTIAGIILSIPLAFIVLYAIHAYCATCEGYLYLRRAAAPNLKHIAASRSQSNLGSMNSVSVIGVGINMREYGLTSSSIEQETNEHHYANKEGIYAKKGRQAKAGSSNDRMINTQNSIQPTTYRENSVSSFDSGLEIKQVARRLHQQPSIDEHGEEMETECNDHAAVVVESTNMTGSLASLSLSSSSLSSSQSKTEKKEEPKNITATSEPDEPEKVQAPARRKRHPGPPVMPRTNRKFPEQTELKVQHNDNNKAIKQKGPQEPLAPVASAYVASRTEDIEFCV